MAFDWEFFANALQQAASMFGQGIRENEQKKEAEKNLRERMEIDQRHTLETQGVSDYNAKARATTAQTYERDNLRLTRDLADKAKADQDQTDRQANAFLNDPDFMADTMRSLSSGPSGQLLVQFRQQAIAKVGAGAPLNPEEEMALQSLGPIARSNLEIIRQKGTEAALGRQQTEEQIKYYQYLRTVDRSGGRGQLTAKDLYDIGRDADAAMADAAAVRNTPEYAMAAKVAYRLGINPETGEATPEQKQQFYKDRPDLAASFFAANILARAKELKGTTGREFLSGTFYAPAPGAGKGAPAPVAVAEANVIKPVDQDARKPGDEGAVKKLERKAGAAFKSALRGPSRFFNTLDAKHHYNIPKGAKVHVIEPGDTPEHLASVVKKGEYLFDPDEDTMFSIGFANGIPTIRPLNKRD
jgi:hypothetical protein